MCQFPPRNCFSAPEVHLSPGEFTAHFPSLRPVPPGLAGRTRTAGRSLAAVEGDRLVFYEQTALDGGIDVRFGPRHG